MKLPNNGVDREIKEVDSQLRNCRLPVENKGQARIHKKPAFIDSPWERISPGADDSTPGKSFGQINRLEFIFIYRKFIPMRLCESRYAVPGTLSEIKS